MIPFNNTIDTFELRGDHLKDLFEHAVYGSWRENKFKGQWLTQVAGKNIKCRNFFLIQIKKCCFVY